MQRTFKDCPAASCGKCARWGGPKFAINGKRDEKLIQLEGENSMAHNSRPECEKRENRLEPSKAEVSTVEAIIARYAGKPGALIPVLEDIQEAIGYIPKAAQKMVAKGLRLPPGDVYGVVTFYSFFSTVPKGRHTARCCLGTACYVRGGKKNMEKLVETLKINPGGTTPDRLFSLETVRCLGACGLAPIVMVDDDTHRQVKPSEIPEILAGYEK
jgi:NADH:ubiquinone oxidoreductase subunit E